MKVRARLAPSPTGSMHIGTLRTALWVYFLARQNNGSFIIRVEDTDQARLVPGALENLLRTFKTLDIDHDEGPVLNDDGIISSKGDYGPYVQSQRLDIYKKFADQLFADGHAYYCFCSKERLEKMREEQSAAKLPPRYDRLCLHLSKEEVATKLAHKESHVLRMKIPVGVSEFDDVIRGRISFNNADIDDQVLVKADGFPTYHLAVVVDDHLMDITHVLRGEEWLSSTPKQIILHNMFGWSMAQYAHVPLLLNANKSKLSKRQGDVSVEDFLKNGMLPEALINFVATLGFNPQADREIYSREELIRGFNLSKVNSSGAVVNREKMAWMNGEYIKKLKPDELVVLVKPWLVEAGYTLEEFDADYIERTILINRERIQLLTDAALLSKCFFVEPQGYALELLQWKTSSLSEAGIRLERIEQFLNTLDEKIWREIIALETAVKELIAKESLGVGDTLWPLRVALTGEKNSPSPFEMMWVLGRNKTIARIRTARARIASL